MKYRSNHYLSLLLLILFLFPRQLHAGEFGIDNIAVGTTALDSLTTGTSNASFGPSSLESVTTGTANIAIGIGAGFDLTEGTNNIYLGNNVGAAAGLEADTIRLGTGNHSVYVPGARANGVDGIVVVTGATGQIGAAGNATIGGTLGVTGAATASSTLAVTGATSLASTLQVNGVSGFDDTVTLVDLYTTGSATIGGGADLVVTGSVVASSLKVDGASLMKDSLTVTGTITMPKTNGVSVGVMYSGADRFIHNHGTQNVFVGVQAGKIGNIGNDDVALGYQALANVGSGYENVAVGSGALKLATGSDQNVAVGFNALTANTNNGDKNVAIGAYSLVAADGADDNVAIGFEALNALDSGSNNIAIGSGAGQVLTTGSNNIYLGKDVDAATSSEANTIRVGNSSAAAVYIKGVRGVTTGVGDGQAIMIDSNGQLGTISSSRRFKKDVASMYEQHDILPKLRKLNPVTFFYKAHKNPKTQYGLIAEEVAELFPELVTHAVDGKIQSVRYDQLSNMLLYAYQDVDTRCSELEMSNEVLRSENDTLKKYMIEVLDRLDEKDKISSALGALSSQQVEKLLKLLE